MEHAVSIPTEGSESRTDQVRVGLAAGIEEHLHVLRRFDRRKRLLELALFFPLWPAGAAVTLLSWEFLPPGLLQYGMMALGILVAAVALNAYVLILHEAMHHTLFASPFWNRWVGVLAGVPLLMSMSAYQVMHLRHHTYLGDPRDPDEYSNYTRRRGLVWLMHFLRLTVGTFLYLALIPLLAWKYGTLVARRRLVQEYAVLGLIYVAVALTVPGHVLLLGWFVPVVLVAYMTSMRGFAQHGLTDHNDPYLASRTMKPHRVVAFFLLNENYHLEHHLFPEVPNYHLAKLHGLIWPRLPRAVSGSSYFCFLLRFFRATLTLDDTPVGLVAPASRDEARKTAPVTRRAI
jgi:fatty acid desaturase